MLIKISIKQNGMQPLRWLHLVRKGIQHPDRIFPYLSNKLMGPKSAVRVEDEVVTWNTLEWGDGNNPAQISAINYHMVQALRRDLQGESYSHAVELGCGYGRLTPWLSEFADQVTGIEPNEEVREYIPEYYPNLEVLSSKGQDIDLPTNTADLLVTRSVLQHIPDEEIERVASEISRISTSGATLLLCEETIGESRKFIWPREVERYQSIFSDWELDSAWRREAPAKTRDHTRMRIKFKKHLSD